MLFVSTSFLFIYLSQISQLKLDIKNLHEELDKFKSLDPSSTKARNTKAQVPLPTLEKPERRRVPSPSPPEPDPVSCPDSPLSEEDILVQGSCEVSIDGESEADDEDAFDNRHVSPVVPCPYIEFVPLVKESKKDPSSDGKKKVGEMNGEVNKNVEGKKEVEENTEDSKEEEEEEGVAEDKETAVESENLAEKSADSNEGTDGGENKGPCLGEDSGYGMAEEEGEAVVEENIAARGKSIDPILWKVYLSNHDSVCKVIHHMSA